jgi:hypothetical protein
MPMQPTRFDTLFSLRYAVRVLERYARGWGRLDAFLRVAAILAGSAAFAALIGENRPMMLLAGGAFALLQALEYGLAPAREEQRALMARTPYAEILAGAAALDDGALETAYRAALAKDLVVVPEALRRVAYNDVVIERGADPREQFVLTSWQRLLGTIA